MNQEKVASSVKKILFSLLFCLLAITVMPGNTAEAASKTPKCVKNHTAYYYVDQSGTIYNLEGYSAYIYIKNLSSSAKITNLKSSNSKFEVGAMNNTAYGTKMNAVVLTNKDSTKKIKNGTTTKISFKVKQGGKTYKLSCNVTFKKAPSPFKTFTVGSKELSSSFKGTDCVMTSQMSGKKKLTVKPSSQFKIDSIHVSYLNGKAKTVKSGSKISMKNSPCITIYYSLKNKPTYYKKPTEYIGGKLSSPLQEYVQVFFVE